MAVNRNRQFEFHGAPDEIDLDIEDLTRADGSVPILDLDFDDSSLSSVAEIASGALKYMAEQDSLSMWG
ncbi:MAG: hypothetical protein ACR2RB_09375 [Gammaproteobacteria bacterium]